ncbi:alpha-ketoglutarate-dependent dioxygenase AlkB family protein [Algoriphagus hitonicola]|uniref:Alkylated DNA repair dioxygenase AlkB n=1 Tax=Algoriphagus hitonicola TaxID=435880 RepID=A0A1I2NLU8_9BACT|nr:alpha-ketoglutarate-dependent dioxygenase AlkB [Algoriphagus hitonicola]SFG04965.1 Alkylated DNA repair dioxygenase AlkB [Algoriphagus hitonicola]
MQQDLFLLKYRNLLPYQGEVGFYDGFLAQEVADLFFKLLEDQVPWKQEPIWMFGKKVMQPRLTALFGDPGVTYSYSGIEMKALDWIEPLAEIRQRLKAHTSVDFTHVLLNYYRDGKDSMGWHRDNESSLGKNPCIASVSLGATRNFQIRHYESKSNKIDIPLNHGSLLIMAGESQHFWEHQIPKTKKELGPRINLTFRKLI